MLSILVIMKESSSNGYKIQYLDKESVLGYVVENVLSKLWATFKPPFLNDLEWHRFNDRVLYQSAFVLPCLPFYASLFFQFNEQKCYPIIANIFIYNPSRCCWNDWAEQIK